MIRKLPKIKFMKIPYKENLETFVWFLLTENNKGPLKTRKMILDRFPELINIAKENMNYEETYNAIKNKFREIYNNNLKNIENNIKNLENIWIKYNDKIMIALEQRLNCKWDNNLIIYGRIAILPVAPRDIKKMTFDLDFENNETYIVDTIIHECTHYLYFKKFKELYPNIKDEQMDNPYIEWILSEAVIDPLLNDNIIQDIYTNEFRSYNIFYELNISNINLMNKIKEIYTKDIDNAIKESYEYFKENEKEISVLMGY